MAGSSGYRRTLSICPDDIDFVEKVPKQLAVECPICMAVLFNPHIMSCCGNHFCETCLERVKDDEQPCPMCKASEYSSLLNKSLAREINQLVVRCPQSKKEGPVSGCPWEGDFGMLENHLSIGERYGACQHVTVGCMYGCGHTDRRSQLQAHEQTACSKRPFSCDYCGEYESTCEDVTERHWKVCSQYIVPCPNECEKKYHKRGDLPRHLEQTCQLQSIACTFAWAGCDIRVVRRDLQEHLDAFVGEHLSKVCLINLQLVGSVQQLQKTTQSLLNRHEESEKMVAQLKTEDSKNKEEIEALRGDVRALNEKLNRLKTDHKTLNEHITSMSNKSKLEKERLARRSLSLESMIGVPPFLFVMDNFDERLRKGEEWFSPPFYTHIGGYRMRVKVTPNGIFFGEGSHVSLTIYLMKGVFDKDLAWPFRGQVRIALLDQLNDSEHRVDTISFDKGTSDNAAGRVREGEINEKGMVSYEFMDHAWLKPISKKRKIYVSNDCLHFKVLSVDIQSA